MRFPRMTMGGTWIRLLVQPLLVLILVLVSVLASASSLAAPAETTPTTEYQNIIRGYGPEDGFSQNAVTALLQAQDGYLWLATFGGLVRFDGEKFTTLRAVHGNPVRLESKDSGGLGSDRIVALREDAKGRIWIGTQDGGLSLYDHGRFQQLRICGGTCQVFKLSSQIGGALWVTTDAGVFRIDTDTLQATLIGDRTAGIYTGVAVGNDAHVYVNGIGKRMGKIAGDGIVPVPLPRGISSTWQMVELGGNIWMMTNKGLYRFDPLRSSWTPKSVEADVNLVESQDGTLWVSTKSGRLLHTDLSGELQPFSGLPAMSVNAVWRDRNGTLWLGSSGKGLWSAQLSKAILHDNADDLSVAGAAGRAVVGDGRGGTWLGFACGGVRRRLADGTYETPRTSLVSEDECIVSMLRDADSNLWLGTAHAGL